MPIHPMMPTRRAAATLAFAALIAASGPVHAEDCLAAEDRDPALARQLAETVLARREVSREDEIAARMCLAWSHVYGGDAERARAESDRLAQAARAVDLDPVRATAALRRAGSVAYSLGDRHRAVELYVDALERAEVAGAPGERIALLVNMGIVLGELSDHDSSLALFAQAQQLIETSGERGHEPQLLNNYGVALIAHGHFDRGLPMLERALELAQAAGNLVGVAHVTHSIGHAYRLQQRYQDAERLLQQALALRRELGARADEGASLLELGRLYQAAGRLPEALAHAESGVELAADAGDERSERDGWLLLSELYESVGRMADALRAARRFGAMQEAFLSEQNLERIAEMEARQRDQLKERELELLRRDNDIQALQLKADRLVRNFTAAALVLAVLVGVAVALYLRRANRRLRRSGAIDVVTQLSNRRFLTKVLDWAQRHFEGTARAGEVREGVLFLIDIDRFKAINDRYGHDGGDAVLKVLGQRLRNVSRTDDRVGRWGGEEFLLIARALSLEEAAEVAERLRCAVANAPVRLPDGRSLQATTSVGFAPWPFFEGGPALTWQQAMRVADRALYMAKDAGRNGWVGIWGLRGSEIEPLLDDVGAAERAGQLRIVGHRPVPCAPVAGASDARTDAALAGRA